MRWLPSLAIVALTVVLGGASAAALEPVPAFGDNPGELDMFVYAPDDLGADAPLVVALHGCTQEAGDFDDATGLRALADAVPFVLLMPQQPEANNSRRCFNFFEQSDNRPGLGESASILAMIDTAEARFGTDPTRVYVLGLSAGGAMTAVMLANYPARFAGGAILAGVPFACNRPGFWTWGAWWWLRLVMGEAAAASYVCGIFSYQPVDRSAEDWGDAVRAVAGTPASWPRVSIWFGDADETVHPANLAELVEQWTDVHGIDAVADVQETVVHATRQLHTDASGAVLVEAWTLPGFGHAVPIDLDSDPIACGAEAPHIENANVCAVQRIAAFWELSD